MANDNLETKLDKKNRLERTLVDSCYYYLSGLSSAINIPFNVRPLDYGIQRTNNGLTLRFSNVKLYLTFKRHDKITVGHVLCSIDDGNTFNVSPLSMTRLYINDYDIKAWRKDASFIYHNIINQAHQWTKRYDELLPWVSLLNIKECGVFNES